MNKFCNLHNHYFLERSGPDCITPNLELRIPEGIYSISWHKSYKYLNPEVDEYKNLLQTYRDELGIKDKSHKDSNGKERHYKPLLNLHNRYLHKDRHILIHSGGEIKDSSGCLLIGDKLDKDDKGDIMRISRNHTHGIASEFMTFLMQRDTKDSNTNKFGVKMKNLIKILWILLVAFWINACGDSKETVQEFGVLSKSSTNCDDSYNEKVCGSDALCSASKCLYKNLTNIDEAFKFYVEQEIQRQVAFSKERNEPENQNTSLLVYKYMLSIALPKENEGKKVTTSIEDYYSKQYGAQNQCDFEFKRTSDSLMIEFNNCADSENNVIIFTQKGGAVEIISKSEAL